MADEKRHAELRGYRFPSEIISHVVWLYHRFCVSFRDVEDLLAQRSITVSYEAIRLCCLKFGPEYARGLKRRQGRLGDTWHLDEVFVTIQGRRQYLWRAVDQDGDDTAGSVLGALATGFLLIPEVDSPGAVAVATACIGLTAVLGGRAALEGRAAAARSRRGGPGPPARLAIPAVRRRAAIRRPLSQEVLFQRPSGHHEEESQSFVYFAEARDGTIAGQILSWGGRNLGLFQPFSAKSPKGLRYDPSRLRHGAAQPSIGL